MVFSGATNSFISKQNDGLVLVTGKSPSDGGRDFHPLEFCIVSDGNAECNPSFATNCINKNNDKYRFRVHQPLKGYLKVRGPLIVIVPQYEDATPMTVIAADDGGNLQNDLVRVAVGEFQHRLVLETNVPGTPLDMTVEKSGDASQIFHLAKTSNQLENVAVDLKECVPGIIVKEYEIFQLFSFATLTYVSKQRDSNTVYTGIYQDANYQQLDFCVVSTDGNCNPGVPTNCIYPDVEYRIKVDSPVKGYLAVLEDSSVHIVPDYKLASGFNLFQQHDSFTGIAYHGATSDNNGFAIAAMGKGKPVVMILIKGLEPRQWFVLEKPKGVE
ncbi:hypothetical protein BG004_002135 [Podila humilis]|nr:hypothetical protein BG004_002135 [Podila humilis]